VQAKYYATKDEYSHVIQLLTASEYNTKRSIKEEGRLLRPVVLNQDNVVLDGHHRIRACQELHIRISWIKKDIALQRITKFSAIENSE
jgi:ParB-like chromosome segregation protein Spo0J